MVEMIVRAVRLRVGIDMQHIASSRAKSLPNTVSKNIY